MKPKNIKRILFIISVFLIGTVILLPVKNRKLSQTELAELRDAKTVQVIIEPVTGNTKKVKFPIRETIKKMLIPAGLKYTAANGAMVFKIKLTARALSRNYSRFGFGGGRKGYTGASISGNIIVLKGMKQFFKYNFSGSVGTSYSILSGSYKYPSSAPFSKAFLKSTFQNKVMDIIINIQEKQIPLLIRYFKSSNFRIRKAAIEKMSLTKDTAVLSFIYLALKDKTNEVRTSAAKALGRFADPESLKPLLSILDDKSKAVRTAVRSALFKIDRNWRNLEACKKLVPVWIIALKDKSSLIVAGAVDALNEISDQRVVKPLIIALMNNYSTRKKIIKVLNKKYSGWRSGPEATEAISVFLLVLKGPDKKKKNNAIQALGELGGPIVQQQLIKTATSDPVSSIRGSALSILSKKYPDWGKSKEAVKNVPSLIKDLRKPSSDLRYQSVKALDVINDPRAIPSLIRLIKDKNSRVSSAALNALKDIDDPRIIKTLAQMLKSNNYRIREKAISALMKRDDPKAVDLLIGAAKDRKYSIRIKAINGLVKKEDSRINKILLDALKDTNYKIKTAAISALGKRKETLAIKPLLKLLKDKNARLRNSASYALKGMVDLCTVDTLLELTKSDSSSLKLSALTALGKYDSPKVIELLIKSMKDKNSNIRLKAVGALGKIDNERTVKPLIAALQDKYYKVREVAVKSLGKRKEVRAAAALLMLLKSKKTVVKKSRYYKKRRVTTHRSKIRNTVFNALENMAEDLPAKLLLDQIRENNYNMKYKLKKLAIKTEDPEAANIYITALKDDNRSVVQVLIEILGSRKERKAIEPLIEKLKSSDRGIKKSASYALKSITGKNYKTKYKKWKKWWKKK